MSETSEDGLDIAGKKVDAGECGPGMRKRRGSRTGAKDQVCFPQAYLDDARSATVLCCADDTDDVTGDTSTGYVVQLLANELVSMGGRIELGITRHQLLLAEGVPYTSHNSSMCFAAKLDEDMLSEFGHAAKRIVRTNSVQGSDPGLCIACVPDNLSTRVRKQAAELIEFGRATQVRLRTKDEAYRLAYGIDWVTLEEHGGTGDGVIGALAGVGLRLSGNDGRFRGAWDAFDLMEADSVDVVSAGELVDAASRKAGGKAQIVRFGTWEELDGSERVLLSHRAKPIYKDGKLTFVAEVRNSRLSLCEKVDLGQVGRGRNWARECPAFCVDNDLEECADEEIASCRNCLYRRWTEKGFSCVIDGVCA